jgi:hypothetical protein
MKTMLKVFSLKTFGAVALSLSMLLGALVATPVTSAFAKIKQDTTPSGYRGNAYQNNLDNDHDEMNESSEQPYLITLPSVNFIAIGKRTIDAGK